MPKLAVLKKVGVPIPATLPPDVTHLAIYWGDKGFTPSYDQTQRAIIPISDLQTVQKDGQSYWVFDPASVQLPAVNGEVDFSFTLLDNTDGEEGDFSPLIALPLDQDPPPALGVAILLD